MKGLYDSMLTIDFEKTLRSSLSSPILPLSQLKYLSFVPGRGDMAIEPEWLLDTGVVSDISGDADPVLEVCLGLGTWAVVGFLLATHIEFLEL